MRERKAQRLKGSKREQQIKEGYSKQNKREDTAK